jgi:tryptophanyl-tRNA synthetase
MSKSYDNTIPLFAPPATLKKLIASIVTDSRAPGEPKDADTSNVFALYQAFASVEESAAMRAAFADGIGWGDAKHALFERIEAEVSPLRETYESLIGRPAEIEAILRDGAQRLRAEHATPLLLRLREAVGLRDLSRVFMATGESAARVAPPMFKQYRDADGKFYFKLVDGDRVLLQSAGFDAPRDAGQRVAALKHEGRVDRGDASLRLGDGVDADQVDAALAALLAATDKP